MPQRIYLILMILGVAVFRCEAQDHPINVDREKVLKLDMQLEDIGPYVSTPYTKTSGVVWRKVISHPRTVAAIRIHIQISRPNPNANWKISFQDISGNEKENLDQNSPGMPASDFWSDEIPGSSAIVELSTQSDPQTMEIKVDRLSYRVQPSFPQSITGADEREPILNVSQQIRKWGTPIVRLRFIASNIGQATCTAFLLNDNLLMTNEHCISTEPEMRSSIAEFNYDGFGFTPARVRAVALLRTNTKLDYSILRLAGNPGSLYGKVSLQIQAAIHEGSPLVIIQHPAGQPKQVSIKGCSVSGVSRFGRESALTDFGHLCDTLGGSSGSPVIDSSNGQVVGLHHLGINGVIVNRAVHMPQILEDLRLNSHGVYQEIVSTHQ